MTFVLWWFFVGNIIMTLVHAVNTGIGDVKVVITQEQSAFKCLISIVWACVFAYLLIGVYYPQ